MANTIHSVLEISVQGADAIAKAAKDMKDLGAGLGSAALKAGHFGGAAVGAVAGGGYSMARSTVTTSASLLKSTLDTLANNFSKLNSIAGKIVNPNSVFSNMAHMFTVAGLVDTSKAINQRAFYSNAVGINPNAMMRLGATYGRFGDPSRQLGAIAGEQAAPYSLPFAVSGMSQQQVRGMGTEDLLSKMTDVARRYAKSPNWGANQMTLEATGLSQMFSVEDMLRLKNMTDEEYETVKKFNEEMKEATKLVSRQSWQDFAMKREVGMAKIETLLQNQAVKLLDPVTHAIDAVFNQLESGPAADLLSRGINHAAELINEFAKALESGNWSTLFNILKGDFEAVGKFIMDSAEKAWKYVHDFFQKNFAEETKTFDEFMNKAKEFAKDLWDLRPTMQELRDMTHELYLAFERVKTFLDGWGIHIGSGPAPAGGGVMNGMQNMIQGTTGVNRVHGQFADLFNRAGAKYGVDPFALSALAGTESSYNPNALSRKGAQGLGQLMPGTFEQYAGRGANPYDPEVNIDAEAQHFKKLLDKFGGDVDMAVAAYNAGEFDPHIKQGKIPPYKETQRQLREYHKRYGELKGATEPSIPDQISSGVKATAEELRNWAATRRQRRREISEGMKQELRGYDQHSSNHIPSAGGGIRLSINNNTPADISMQAALMGGAIYG
jgi:hypothetical protein